MLNRKNYKFWFCTGSQDLYGDECLEHVAQHAKIIVEKLNESGFLPYEVVWKPTLITSTLIRKTFNEANMDEECAGVITWMHTFSPAKSWIIGLQEYRNHRNDKHWRKRCRQSTDQSSRDAANPISCDHRHINSQRSRCGLGNHRQIQNLILRDPVQLVRKYFAYHPDDHKSSAKGAGTQHKNLLKKFEINLNFCQLLQLLFVNIFAVFFFMHNSSFR